MATCPSVRVSGLSLLTCLTLNVSAVSAQGGAPGGAQVSQPPASIRAVGEATVSAKPDQVEIDIGVTTQAQFSREAATRNANLLSQVLKELETTLGTSATVETISYALTPDYRYPREGGKPTITSYTATNTVRVTLNGLTRVGDAIDAAAKAGANQIHRVRFTLKDDQAVQAQALREAAMRAKSQAEALASALGVKITRVLSATESEPMVRPFQDVMTLRTEAASSATPIQPGTIDVRAVVTLTVEISDSR